MDLASAGYAISGTVYMSHGEDRLLWTGIEIEIEIDRQIDRDRSGARSRWIKIVRLR